MLTHVPRRSTQRAAALVCLLSLVCLSSACGKREIITVDDEAEAIEIIDVLTTKSDGGIMAYKEPAGEGSEAKGWRVMVDEGWFGSHQDTLAMQILRDNGLPRPRDKSLDAPTGGTGMLPPTDQQEKAKQLREQQSRIERQLRTASGIMNAHVIISPAEEAAIKVDPHPASASVLLVYQGDKPSLNVDAVRALVASAVPNLSPDRVAVTFSQEPSRAAQLSNAVADAKRTQKLWNIVTIVLLAVTLALLSALIMQRRRQRAEGEAPAEAEADRTTAATAQQLSPAPEASRKQPKSITALEASKPVTQTEEKGAGGNGSNGHANPEATAAHASEEAPATTAAAIE